MPRKLLLVLVVLVVVVVGGGVVYLQRPSLVVAQAVSKFGDADSAAFAATLQLENAQATQQQLGEQGTIELQLDGVFARQEAEQDTLQADVVFATKTESVSVNIEGEVRFISDKAYLYVEKAPQMLAPLAQLKGMWLELERGPAVAEETRTAPEQLFVNIERTGTAELNGETVTVYKAVADDQAVIVMMDSMAELLGTRLTQEQITNLRSSVGRVQQVPVELKVKRWSRQLRQLRAVLDVPGGNKVNFTLTITDTNQPVKVTVPEGAVSLTEAAQALQQQPPVQPPVLLPPTLTPTPTP